MFCIIIIFPLSRNSLLFGTFRGTVTWKISHFSLSRELNKSQGKDFFLIGQKSVKQCLRYSNCIFQDLNQGFGEKTNNINDVSEIFWSLAIAFASCFVVCWKTYNHFGGKIIVPILGLEIPFNNLKLCLYWFPFFLQLTVALYLLMLF